MTIDSNRSRRGKAAKRPLFAELPEAAEAGEEESDLPRDEVGRRKIKRQYQELLGIRIEKLKGRVLNRERINKTIDGTYFICARCVKICHSLDEGLVEDPDNRNNLCAKCSKNRPVSV